MAQHFLLTPEARNFSLDDVEKLCEEQCRHFLAQLRWGEEDKQVCPACGVVDKHYYVRVRGQWRCKDCGHTFSVTSGTKLADHKLTNDAVAVESGRGKGTIKKSRPVFATLIAAVAEAAAEQVSGANQQKNRLDRAKATADEYRLAVETALAREVSLLHELRSVKKELARLTGGNVVPLRPPTRQRLLVE